MTEQEAYVTLNMLPKVGPVTVRHLLEHFGNPQRILISSLAELKRVPGVRAPAAASIANWQRQVDPVAEIRAAEQSGVTIITAADDDYPPMLTDLYDPPLCLYLSGDRKALEMCNKLSIAFVGSRHVTHYGVTVTDRLASAAAAAGWCVVSGLAVGVDTGAHRAVVKGGGRTVAVIGSGLASLYPSENVDLARKICTSGGAVVSEFPLQRKPDRQTFPMRNRIIAALSLGTVVVEAGHKSGSLITANQALDLGRHVFAVPGPITSPQSSGCHKLLRDGATLVENFGDISDALGMLLTITPNQHEPRLLPELNEAEQTLVNLLQKGPIGADDLVVQSGLPPHEALSTLLMLEIKKVALQLPGRRYELRT